MEERKPRGRQPLAIAVTTRQKEELERITRSTGLAHALVLRASIILQASQGARNTHIAQDVGCHIHTVRTWRGRWAEAQPRLAAAEAENDKSAYQALLHTALADQPRSGAPGKFTAEQLCQMIAVACQPPEEVGRPVSHWTPRELADEVVKQEIVASISVRHIGRFLKGGHLKAASQSLLAEQRTGAGQSGI
ncbi:MAG: helix-turn-helix domain-containing protein [Ardenticatenales bacterium]|nr:helix-turn-helix domain-containing protein [Ardenticatenales bacterium]